MDPNATLAELRRLLAKDSDKSTRADRGGFLPTDWSKPR